LVVSFVDFVEDKGDELKKSEKRLGKVFGGLVRWKD